MSNRTAKANQAVAAAWEREAQLILDGKGTRNWSPQQQQDIIEHGKAYDENGKAYEGHHMKSVEAHPDHQGEAGNIQLLSRSEHRAAHDGNFQNPTNGYYDPSTGNTTPFEESSYEPCETITLSEPLYSDQAIQPGHIDAPQNTTIANETSQATSFSNDVESGQTPAIETSTTFAEDMEASNSAIDSSETEGAQTSFAADFSESTTEQNSASVSSPSSFGEDVASEHSSGQNTESASASAESSFAADISVSSAGDSSSVGSFSSEGSSAGEVSSASSGISQGQAH